MSAQYVSFKAYFEGIEIPIESAQITSGATCTAFVTIAKVNHSLLLLKPETLLHLFIFYQNKWRIFFMGKMGGVTFSKSSCQIQFTSIFDELAKAYYTPVDISNTYFGHLTPLLYVSNADQKERSDTQETQILINNNANVDYFSYSTLEAKGNVGETIKGFLEAAASVNPGFKIYHDLFKFQDWFYILDNPNIFPIAKIISLGTMMKSVFSDFNFKITYQNVIDTLLNLLRYKTVKLNTPVKIGDKWHWVLMLPDFSWLPAVKKITLENKELLSYSITDDSSSKITRAQMHFQDTEAVIDLIAQSTFSFIYSYPPEALTVKEGADKKNRAYIRFTEEEKVRGVNAYNVSLDDSETYYCLTDWRGSAEKNNGKVDPKHVAEYFPEMAKYAYLRTRFKSIGLTTFSPLFNPAMRYIFPIQIEQIPGFVFNVRSVSYDITQNAMGMSVFPENIRSLYDGKGGTDPSMEGSLRWDPDVYKAGALPDYYGTYDFDEMMSEEEFWKTYPGSWKEGTPRYHISSNLNAQYIANMKGSLEPVVKSIFSYERGLAVQKYYKTVYGKDVDLQLVDGGMLDMNTDPSALVPTVSQGGMDFSAKESSSTVENDGTIVPKMAPGERVVEIPPDKLYPETGEGTPNPRFSLKQEHIHLVPYTKWIEYAAAKFGLGNPNWIRAIILTESVGNTLAVSTKGALGIMQVMPSHVINGAWKKTPGGAAVTTTDLARDPKININIGCHVLREFLNTAQVKDRMEYALQAYNGGVRNINTTQGFKYSNEVFAWKAGLDSGNHKFMLDRSTL